MNNIEVMYELFCTKDQRNMILPFCFPEEGESASNDLKVFSFTLTGLDGTRKVGYCKRSTLNKPYQCICLVTGHACFSLFSSLMETIWYYFVNDFQTFVQVCDDLYQQKFPLPGESVVSSSSLHSAGYCFVRPLTRDVYAVGAMKLLEKMGVSTVLFIIGQMLIERKFVFVGDCLSDISNTIRCFMELIQPFVWQHVYIPIVPKRMTSYGAAPMPYIIGCLRNLYDILKSESDGLSDVFVVDVNSGSFIYRPDFPNLLVGQRVVKLTSALTALLKNKSMKDENIINGIVYNQLFLLYRSLFFDYDKFFIQKKNSYQFQWKKFVQQSDESNVPFLEEFQQSQMCFMFIDERVRVLNEGKELGEYCPFLMESFENKEELEFITVMNLCPNSSEQQRICCRCGLKIQKTDPCCLIGDLLCHSMCRRCVTCMNYIEGNPEMPTEQCSYCYQKGESPLPRPFKEYQVFHETNKNGNKTEDFSTRVLCSFSRKKKTKRDDSLCISEPVPDLKTFSKYVGAPDVEMITQPLKPRPSQGNVVLLEQPEEKMVQINSDSHEGALETEDITKSPTKTGSSDDGKSPTKNPGILTPSDLPSHLVSTQLNIVIQRPAETPPPKHSIGPNGNFNSPTIRDLKEQPKSSYSAPIQQKKPEKTLFFKSNSGIKSDTTLPSTPSQVPSAYTPTIPTIKTYEQAKISNLGAFAAHPISCRQTNGCAKSGVGIKAKANPQYQLSSALDYNQSLTKSDGSFVPVKPRNKMSCDDGNVQDVKPKRFLCTRSIQGIGDISKQTTKPSPTSHWITQTKSPSNLPTN